MKLRAAVLSIVLTALLLAVAAAPASALVPAGDGGWSWQNPLLTGGAYLHFLAGAPSGLPAVADGHPLGEIPGPQDYSYARGLQVAGGLRRDSLPARYDLRALGRVGAVRNQGRYGTCWAFAALGALESSLMPAESDDFSEDNLVLQSGFDSNHDPYNHGGTVDEALAYLVRWSGPVSESDDAYGDGHTPPGLTACKHVQEVDRIPLRGSALDNDNIKNALMRYGAVYTTMLFSGSSYGSEYYNPSTASYYYAGPLTAPNHGVDIVGWDDDYPASNFVKSPPGNGAFIVRNSWGASWGDGGYSYVSYYDTEIGSSWDPMAVFPPPEPTSDYSDIYQYDPLGDTSQYLQAGSARFANVFVARQTCALSAVGFCTELPGSDYQVFTGSSLAALTLRRSVTLAYMGYHTVSLPSPVSITGGQPFVVAVKVSSPGGIGRIGIEKPFNGYSSGATASPGQSYVSTDGTNWTDMTSIYANTNVCLKAYTKPSVAPIIGSITGISPSAGLAGSSVTLTGSGLARTLEVAFSGAKASSFRVDGDTQVEATVPPGARSGPITLATDAGSAQSGPAFRLICAPHLTSFAPAYGLRSSSVTLTGWGFTDSTSVSFGAAAASFTVDSDTQIEATVPADALNGPISITNALGSGQSATNFTVTLPCVITLKLGGLRSGAIRHGRWLTVKGTLSPSGLAVSTVTLTAQRRHNGRWYAAKRVLSRIAGDGSFHWKYRPTCKATYRLHAVVASSATNAAAQTTWRAFKVT